MKRNYWDLDLSNLDEFNSLERELYRRIGTINLQNYDQLPVFDYTHFDIDRFKLPNENESEASFQTRSEKIFRQWKCMKTVTDSMAANKEDQLFSSINEAIRNAQKHGNKLDETKKIGFGFMYEPKEKTLELLVEDSGGEFRAELLQYRRQLISCLKEEKTVPSFYEYVQEKSPKGHSGIGSRIIHEFADEVTYHKSPDLGGLLVRMKYQL